MLDTSQILFDDKMALVGVLFGVSVTAGFALLTNIKDHARLFTSVTFFALAWAVLFPFYLSIPGRTAITPEVRLLAALQGVLLAFAGGPLRREADVRKHGKEDPKVGVPDRWMMGLLLATMCILPSLHIFNVLLNDAVQLRVFIIVCQILVIAGNYSIVDGVRRLNETTRGENFAQHFLVSATMIVASGYVITEVIWAIHSFYPQEVPYMSEDTKIAFAISKILLTLTFVPAVWLMSPGRNNESAVPARESSIQDNKPSHQAGMVIIEGPVSEATFWDRSQKAGRDIIAAETMKDCIKVVKGSNLNGDLKKDLQLLIVRVDQLLTKLPSDEAQQLARDVETFTKEAASPSRREEHVKHLGDKIKETTKRFAEFAEPVAELAKPVAELITTILKTTGQPVA